MIHYYWEKDCQSVIRFEITEDWDWVDFHHSIKEVKAIVAGVGYPVIVLIDAREVKHIPKDAFNHISTEVKLMPPNLKAQVIVSENRWLESIFAIIAHLMPEEAHRLIFVRTMEKAQKKVEILSRPPKKKRRRMLEFQ